MSLNFDTRQAALDAATIRIQMLEAEVTFLLATANKWKRAAFAEARATGANAPTCDTCDTPLGYDFINGGKVVLSWCVNSKCAVGADSRNATSL